MLDELDVVVMTMDAGDLKQAAYVAHAANETVARKPEIKFELAINGLDDDPRDIDQVDTARASLRMLYTSLTHKAFWRFDPVHQALMLVAMNLGYRRGDQLIVPHHLVRKP